MSENYGFAVSMTGDAISQLEKLSHKLVEAHEKGEGLSSVFKSMLGANLAMSGISAAANLLKEGFNKTIESSGELADKFTVAMTTITNGICIFLLEPYSSTSYSIWTRGARLRAMNFWLLPDMTLVSWKIQ